MTAQPVRHLAELTLWVLVGAVVGALLGCLEGLALTWGGISPVSGAQAGGLLVFLPALIGISLIGGVIYGVPLGAVVGLALGALALLLRAALRERTGILGHPLVPRGLVGACLGMFVLWTVVNPTGWDDLLLRAGLITTLPNRDRSANPDNGAADEDTPPRIAVVRSFSGPMARLRMGAITFEASSKSPNVSGLEGNIVFSPNEALDVAVGQEVEVSFPAGNVLLTGKIIRAIPATTKPVRPDIFVALFEEVQVAPDRMGTARIRTGTHDAVLVPSDAVTLADPPYVCVLQRGLDNPDSIHKLVKRTVAINPRRDVNTEITEGLESGVELSSDPSYCREGEVFVTLTAGHSPE